MRKILNILVTIVLLCSMVFLGGEWSENTPRKRVVACDAVAFVVMVGCGFYLKKEYDNGQIR